MVNKKNPDETWRYVERLEVDFENLIEKYKEKLPMAIFFSSLFHISFSYCYAISPTPEIAHDLIYKKHEDVKQLIKEYIEASKAKEESDESE